MRAVHDTPVAHNWAKLREEKVEAGGSFPSNAKHHERHGRRQGTGRGSKGSLMQAYPTPSPRMETDSRQSLESK